MIKSILKMKKVIIIVFFISGLMNGQNKITQNLGDFNVIKSYRGLSIELIKTDSPKVVIEGEKSDEVIIKNINGVLKITMTALETFSSNQAKVTIYYKNDIDIIDVNEGSFIRSDEIFEQKKIELKSQEAGKINLKIKTEQLDVKVVTGGQIEVEGFSKNQNVKVNTGGIYKGKGLETEYTNVSSSTGSTASISASKLVDANANLGATIKINGDPEEIKKKESLGGYIKE
jgi:hypothetical protein